MCMRDKQPWRASVWQAIKPLVSDLELEACCVLGSTLFIVHPANLYRLHFHYLSFCIILGTSVYCAAAQRRKVMRSNNPVPSLSHVKLSLHW